MSDAYAATLAHMGIPPEGKTEMTGLEMKYFVLKPEGKTPYHHASRAAMYGYADAIEEENPEFANDLRNWAGKETARAILTPNDTQQGDG